MERDSKVTAEAGCRRPASRDGRTLEGQGSRAPNPLPGSVAEEVLMLSASWPRYAPAHHLFYATLARIDRRMIAINLVYLAFIAFLPFPTVLLGTYFENPLSVTVYAVTVAIVSGLEVVLFRHAHRARLLTEAMPEDVYRWGVLQSL